MKLLLDRSLKGEDVALINASGIDYTVVYRVARIPQDLGWRDFDTGQVLPTVNHRVVFNLRNSEEETFLRLHFTSDLKEV